MTTTASSDAEHKQPIDKAALLSKYRAERAKRLRADGNAQYLALKGRLAHYLDDPYTPVKSREAKTDHVTFAFVGGGFAGLVTGARLIEAGVRDVRIIEKGGDFGGTWYWNRYPGAQCDTASMVYMPLLEKPAIGRPRNMHTRRKFWLIAGASAASSVFTRTRCFTPRSRSGMGRGELALAGRDKSRRPIHSELHRLGDRTPPCAQTAGHSGYRNLQGPRLSYQSLGLPVYGRRAGWRALDKLADKRVAIIGTGATAIQCVPHLAGACRELYVFQRTPSSVDVRANGPIDPDWFASIAAPGWQQRWLENFTDNQPVASADGRPGAGRLDRPVAAHPHEDDG